MAKENMTKFFELAVSDQDLAEKVVAFAAKNGFEFTTEELLEAGAARPISDEDAEATVGGTAIIKAIIKKPKK